MRRAKKTALLVSTGAVILFVCLAPVLPYSPISIGPSGFDHASMSFIYLGRGVVTGVVYSGGSRFYVWCSKFDEGGVACTFNIWPDFG